MLSSDQLNATDEQILSFMDEHGRVTPSWVAEETDNARAYVSQRLKRLREHGHVEQPYRGLWDLVADPRDGSEDGQKEADRDTQTPGFEPEEPPSNRPESHDIGEPLRDELPGSGDRLEARVEAIEQMYEYLREHGSAEKSDLLNAIDVEATGYASPESVWSNMVKGKDTLRALPGIEPPASGMSEWRYVE